MEYISELSCRLRYYSARGCAMILGKIGGRTPVFIELAIVSELRDLLVGRFSFMAKAKKWGQHPQPHLEGCSI